MAMTSPTSEPLLEAREDLPSELLLGQNRILNLVARGIHLDQVLTEFCHVLEYSIPDARCCVMLFNPADTTLVVGAAPSLPVEFRNSINGLTVGSAPGACSAAAHRNEIVITPSMATDPEWEGLRQKVLESKLAACWSAPIRGVRWAADQRERDEVWVLGTVAFYYDGPRSPTTRELRVLEMTSALASLAINTARTHEKLGRQGLYDSVTGLPNRKVFTEKLKESLDPVTPHDDKLAVLLLDLDHFKEVNDTFGYAVGDFLLRSVAERLVAYRRPSDMLARFGDDEFVFLVGEISRNDDIKEISKQILSAVAEPYDFSGQQLAVSASLGASLYPWDGEDAQTLLRNAENALYAAKQQGRNRFRLYAPTMGGYAFEKLQLKMALGYAVENQELEVLYQPKVRSEDGAIVGAEALIYWNHPGEGQLSPGRFIPLAEDSGLILPIGDFVLKTACSQVESWRRAGLDHMSVAVNISAIQFRERSFVEKIGAILERTGLAPQALELEITETIAMTEVEQTMRRMTELEQLGVRIAIDDFGTGYSSLAYLKRFPIHTLKIDKSFILKLPADKENLAIVKAVIALATNLGLDIVAEGVETAEQASVLKQHGCELLQGFHFSRPVSADEFYRLARLGKR